MTVSWQDFNALLSFIFVVGTHPASPAFWGEFSVIVHILAWSFYNGGAVKYMPTCRTFKFPKTQVGHIHVIKPKYIKSESDLKDHGQKTSLCR